MIKSKLITSLFQKYLKNKDIRFFKNSILYYCTFRIIRNFLSEDIVLKIFNFKIFGSINKNNTSYFLLKKCDFGDNHELETIKNISKNKKIFFIDCGCNYGFYSFYVASISRLNKVISIDASQKILDIFKKNLSLNNFSNIITYNRAVSDLNNSNVVFNESKKDWESSIVHENFKSYKKFKIKTINLDSLVGNFNLEDYYPIIKLDVEGNEVSVLKGCLEFVKEKSPLIIIEFSKYTLDKQSKIDFMNFFLLKYDYLIYSTNNKKNTIKDIIMKLNKLEKRQMTIGNFYLVKNNSENLMYLKIYE